MKFKIIFLLFNIVVVLSFLIVFFMPLFLLGWGYTGVFWRDTWYLPLLFLLVIGGIDTYFVMNWKLFSLLEREEWDGVIEYLEQQVYEKEKVKNFYIRILANAYLVRSDINGMVKLEAMVRRKSGSLLKRHVLTLGVPALLRDDADAMIAYFSEFTHDPQVKDRYWVRYLTAYGRLLKNEPSQAKDILLSICRESADPVLLLLVIYSLYPFAKTHAGEDVSEAPSQDSSKDAGENASQEDSKDSGRQVYECVREKGRFLRKKYTKEQFIKQVDQNKDNLIVVILRKLIDESVDWLYGEAGREFST